ncbi:nuclear transport factor 2 family protein [Puia dinghuensis]|uniref:nuclear transport factor 2 family protein n=1 Tax=Puia dinghuensis TaxID=1792502 RepID=UPI001667FBF3|nr:nuclear transport factor 2 family protein [Puia dinghuensis]
MKNSLYWVAACCLLFSCNSGGSTSAAKDTTAAAPVAPATPPQSEFADARYTEMGKKMMAQFAAGDIPAWMDNYADNAVYIWSSGDSLSGKAAIAKYWTERRGETDSVRYLNDIWLPMKVNRPQQGPDIAGVWLLNWREVHLKFKNGKRIGFWAHTASHYNAADKVDRVVAYVDRAPINKALGVH